MNISLSEFDDLEYTSYNVDFQDQVEALNIPADEVLYLAESFQGIVLSYEEVVKLDENSVNLKLMTFIINYYQTRATQISQFYICVQGKNLLMADQMNEIFRIKQKQGDPLSYTFLLYWKDRWVCGIYFIKTNLLEIVDLQTNKTRDQLKTIFDGCLKMTGLQKYQIKTVTYVQQDDKEGDGGVSILYYIYQTFVKLQPFQRQNQESKYNFRMQLLWLIYKSERSMQTRYPPLPPLTNFNEKDLKTFKNAKNDPFLTDAYTGIEVLQEDFELLQNKGKSNPKMMAFWLSYLYSFDLERQVPMLPFFVVTQMENVLEYYEGVFKPRRRKSDHVRLIILSLIKERWIMAIYNMVQKQLQIIDLQHKNITKDELTKLFENILSNLVEYQPQKPIFITQTNTDSTDGTEYIINFLWAYFSGTLAENIKFGYFEKKSLRQKLVWVLVKIFNNPYTKSQSSVRSIMKPVDVRESLREIGSQRSIRSIKSTKSIKEINEETSPPKRRIFGKNKQQQQQNDTQESQDTPQSKKTIFQQKKTQSILKGSPMNKSDVQSPSQAQLPLIQQKKSSFSRKRKASDHSPSSQKSDTSINIQAPRFGRANKNQVALQKSQSKNNTILETQRSEEQDEDYSEIFKKRDKIQQQQNRDDEEDQNYLDNPLDRIQKDLEQYYHNLLNDEEQEIEEGKLKEIFRIKNNIQKVIETRQKKPIEEVVDTLKINQNQSQISLYNSSLQNYSTVIHEDRHIMQMLNEMLDDEDPDATQQQSILKRRKYIEAELSSLDMSQPTFHAYDFPQSTSLPSIKNQSQIITQSEIFKRSNLAAQRYGFKIEIPLMQQFYKDGKMPVILLNFLFNFLTEKNQHKRIHNGTTYQTKVKLFPTAFYLTLCNNLLHSTFRINYYQANQYTFENTGEGQTIFEEFDWLIVPIVELPNEYSIVAVDLKRRALYCYILSSLATRIRDPLFINPEKNPYMRNVFSFLQMEYEIKCKRPRDELGRFSFQFGYANDSNNFSYSIDYSHSGVYAFYIVNHIVKNGHNEDIKIDEYQVTILIKTLHDLVVRIGYNIDDNLFHLLEGTSWPF